MVSFCEEIIKEIKGVSTDLELREVVRKSFVKLRAKGMFNERDYIMNMIVSLRAAKANQLDHHSVEDLDHAIEIFREYNLRNSELFLNK